MSRIPQTLDTVPEEILLQVVASADGPKNRHRVCCILTRVNRRLHRVVVPLLLKNVRAPWAKDLTALKSFLSSPAKDYSDLIQGIRVGSGVYSEKSRYKGTPLTLRAFDIPFLPNLRHFESLEYRCSSGLLFKLSNAPLISLAIGMTTEDPLVNLGDFPDLQEFRLSGIISDSITCLGHLYLPRTRHLALTTFVVAGMGSQYHGCSSCKLICLDNLHLPNLRVLSLQDMNTDAVEIYHFIQQHPSLLEVNISFDYTYKLSLSSLKKLMDGNGVWKHHGTYTGSLDDPVSDEDEYSGGFAFARRCIAISHITGYPEYEVTEFAWVPLVDTASDGVIIDFPDFISELELERFSGSLVSFSYASECSHVDSFGEFMMDLGHYLRNFVNLRQLTICMTGHPVEPIAGYQIPRIDYVGPPLCEHSKSLTLAHRWVKTCEKEDLAEYVLSTGLVHPTEDINDFPLMCAWEARHYVTVAAQVRLLAERLPSLQKFHWYPDELSEMALWRWTIFRTGTGAVNMVKGDLKWNGCGQGTPPSLPRLVGQELAYYLERSGSNGENARMLNFVD